LLYGSEIVPGWVTGLGKGATMKKGSIIRSLKLIRWVMEVLLLLPVFFILEIGIKKAIGVKKKNLLLLKLLKAYKTPLVPVDLVPMEVKREGDVVRTTSGVYKELEGKPPFIELRENAGVVTFCMAYFHEMRHAEQYKDPDKKHKIYLSKQMSAFERRFLKLPKTFKDYYNAWWEVDARRAERVESRKFARFCLYHPLWVVRTLLS